jgi:hypothetical protein
MQEELLLSVFGLYRIFTAVRITKVYTVYVTNGQVSLSLSIFVERNRRNPNGYVQAELTYGESMR